MKNRAGLDEAVRESVGAALGREHRDDPVLPRTGGPAGNARLTAWTGLVLLVLFVAELVTLLDVHGLIGWHLALGVLLVPPALLKTATTGWRIARYYLGNQPYVVAGPPPLLLRVLGPLVVLGTLVLLGSGVALVALGEAGGRRTLVTMLGWRLSVLGLHQVSFVVWAVVTGLHLLGRLLPAWQLTRPSGTATPGPRRRAVALVVTLALAATCAGWVLVHDGGWRSDRFPHGPGDFRQHSLGGPAAPG